MNEGDRRKQNIFECCILCGCITDVKVDEPIANRPGYMPGAGQLCRECAINVYGTDDLRRIRWQ